MPEFAEWMERKISRHVTGPVHTEPFRREQKPLSHFKVKSAMILTGSELPAANSPNNSEGKEDVVESIQESFYVDNFLQSL